MGAEAIDNLLKPGAIYGLTEPKSRANAAGAGDGGGGDQAALQAVRTDPYPGFRWR